FGEDADDAEGDVFDAHGLADRVLIGEELIGDGLADDADLGNTGDFALAEELAGLHGPIADDDVIGADAGHFLGAPVDVAADDLAAGRNDGRDGKDRRALG